MKESKSRAAEPGEIVAVLRRIFAENARDYVGLYVFTTACLVVVALTTAFTAWIMRDVIDEIFYRQRSDLIALLCLSILAAFVLRGIASYGQAVALARIGNNLVARYQRRLFEHLMLMDVGFFNEKRSGELAAQVGQNVAGIRDMVGLTITGFARDLIGLVALVGVMIAQDPVLSMAALFIGPPLVLAVTYVMRRIRTITRKAVLVNSRLTAAFQEAFQGISVVKAFTMEERLNRQMNALAADAEARSNHIARVSERLTPITEILAGLAVSGVIAYAGYEATAGGHAPGAVFAFITALLLAYDPARRLARLQVGLERSLVNARMIYEILDAEPMQGDVPGAGPLQAGPGEIVFDRVGFAYKPGPPVLRDLTFVAKAGRTTAIVGASGAGKSTVVALLQRFFDVATGSIHIDGQDISKVTKRSLRSSIAYVSQQPYLFEGTIRDNIRYGREDASDAEIEDAARRAQADDFIRQQPQGYDTPLGENGVTLSGGQRQRVSIARAIVRDAPILLLDEATSALDNEAEAKLQQALTEVMRGRTTIVIAHRLSTVLSADHIVVLEEGRLVEEGTHDALVSDQRGVYSRFHRLYGGEGLGLQQDTAETVATPRKRVRRSKA